MSTMTREERIQYVLTQYEKLFSEYTEKGLMTQHAYEFLTDARSKALMAASIED